MGRTSSTKKSIIRVRQTKMDALEVGDWIVVRGKLCMVEMIQGRGSARAVLEGTNVEGFHERIYFKPGDSILAEKKATR